MEPVCMTRQGAVRGRMSEQGVASFLGIPFAAAPFGPRRFHAPVPPASRKGVWEAHVYGATAPKAPYMPPFDSLIPEDLDRDGENCLNLNVWTPQPGPNGNLPVLVWLHGGAFSNGSGGVSAYDGGAFARDGVVCVTVNYRLGVDGFLHLKGVPDNRGLLDQIAALEWVHENITSFGGDPDRVTVFGESAGAMSIGALLRMERARGLFRRAVLQSGAAHHFLRPASAALIAGRLAGNLGIAPTAEAFAGVPLAELMSAQGKLRAELGSRPDPCLWGEASLNMMPFEPVFPELALPGPDCGVDLLVGSNREENRLFMVPTERLDTISEKRLRLLLTGYGLDADDALAVYRATRPGAGPGELFDAVVTDWFYRIPALRLAEAVPGSHVYEFAWRSPQYGGRLGACHGCELGFVFDNLGDPSYAAMLGACPPQSLADAMHGTWVAFATTGDPGWAAYEVADSVLPGTAVRGATAQGTARPSRTTMVFGEQSAAESDPRAQERALWSGVR